MTVVVLVVMWLVVVVPMIVRRNDERRRDRDIAGFGRAMRALGRRSATQDDARTEVFTPRPPLTRPAEIAKPDRRPVPVAQEALMYPVDRTDLSAARAQMIARRRRSLLTLLGGTVLFGLLALVMGGATWFLAGMFAVGLLGYLYFLRSMALRDRDRREQRQMRASRRRPRADYDATEDLDRFDAADATPTTVVRIDDDDIELMSMDTMDLTGLYEAEEPADAVQRRAS
jgi:hypothetical protein